MKTKEKARNICVFGATSGIAEQTVRILAASGHNLTLVARSGKRLESIANHIEHTNTINVKRKLIDLENIDDYHALYSDIVSDMGDLDTVLIFHGFLGDQLKATNDADEFDHILSANYTSAAQLALNARSFLENSGHSQPVLLAVGSVAGDRGRAKNYIYGASKGALEILFQGMRHEAGQNNNKLKVVLVKAGLTDTAMTADFDKNGLLWSSPQTVAKVIVKSIDSGNAEVYAPAYWRYIMQIIKLLPYCILNRLSI